MSAGRANPADGARAGVLRVVVTGSECTGKTTLAAALAAHYGTTWVAEQSRLYAHAKGGALEPADVEPIARATIAAEAIASPHARAGLLVLDTDLVSTVVYAGHYYGDCPAWIQQAAEARRADLYLLCHTDVPWVEDAVRDRPHVRERMHALFHGQLVHMGAAIAQVHGGWAEREARARAAIDALRAARAAG